MLMVEKSEKIKFLSNVISRLRKQSDVKTLLCYIKKNKLIEQIIFTSNKILNSKNKLYINLRNHSMVLFIDELETECQLDDIVSLLKKGDTICIRFISCGESISQKQKDVCEYEAMTKFNKFDLQFIEVEKQITINTLRSLIDESLLMNDRDSFLKLTNIMKDLEQNNLHQ